MIKDQAQENPCWLSASFPDHSRPVEGGSPGIIQKESHIPQDQPPSWVSRCCMEAVGNYKSWACGCALHTGTSAQLYQHHSQAWVKRGPWSHLPPVTWPHGVAPFSLC